MVAIRNKIIMKKVSELKGYAKNNKNHPEEQISLLVENIDKFGFTTPLLIDKNNVLIAGHGRKEAAARLNMEEVPCIVVDDLSKKEIQALRISDNRIAEMGETDWLNLKEEWLDLRDSEGDLEFLTGYKEEDFQLTSDEQTEVVEDNFVDPKDIQEVKTDLKKGSIIRLGNHRVMCGDSTIREEVDKLIDGNKISLLFTDPPYNINYQDMKGVHKKIANDKMDDSLFQEFLEKAFSTWSIEAGYICCNWKYYHLFYQAMWNTGIPCKSCIVWDKEYGVQNLDKYHKQHEFILYFGPFGGQKTLGGDIYRLKRERNNLHPTMKPIELCAKFIQDNTGESVLDLFGGSGSTLIACEQLKRQCYMMELDEKYCEVICQRWEKLTGESREVLN